MDKQQEKDDLSKNKVRKIKHVEGMRKASNKQMYKRLILSSFIWKDFFSSVFWHAYKDGGITGYIPITERRQRTPRHSRDSLKILYLEVNSASTIVVILNNARIIPKCSNPSWRKTVS
ncbi:hypothetical protein [Sporosarcina sp. NCCP-2378]|uniref:hypothetical protein n=1 Tax=Sporosarcina sp. NCCP-2378 TaxID=2934651 RepID=UPI002231C861|nr:hypothetical protein [Sporosarcina sp. NCCP-2378]